MSLFSPIFPYIADVLCRSLSTALTFPTHSLTFNSFAESNDLVEDIQAVAKAIGIQDMDINNFINPTEERVVDSTDDIIDLIVAQCASAWPLYIGSVERTGVLGRS